ncbi:MAG: pantetheine-phosphate adenylyltransferase [Candidatus Altiarchaeota archaeon]|nr:pantetheine-phosphate adenylyltransferase [Candidatus Altiarchaeota archaeon]
MFKRIVVGGTFEGLHDGHKLVLKTAFENAKSVVIGLTSDDFAERFRTRKVSVYTNRKNALGEFVKAFDTPYEVVEINDSYGVATIDKDMDCIVVSEETLLRAEEINTIRFKKGLPKLTVIVVPLVLDSEGVPLSSSR